MLPAIGRLLSIRTYVLNWHKRCPVVMSIAGDCPTAPVGKGTCVSAVARGWRPLARVRSGRPAAARGKRRTMSNQQPRQVVPFRRSDWSAEALATLFATGWPEFIHHDQDVNGMWDQVRATFDDFELGLHADGDLIGTTWSVPIRWDGTTGDLPGGYAGTLRRALDDQATGAAVNALVVLAAQVRSDVRRSGVATELIVAQKELAAARHLTFVICPVRPTLKVQYPLIDIADFANWTGADGLPLDPWLRTHVRLGGRILGVARTSQVITGSVADWEQWTGMVFPSSGDYVIPAGLSILRIDVAADTGVYVEPNIWVDHSSAPT